MNFIKCLLRNASNVKELKKIFIFNDFLILLNVLNVKIKRRKIKMMKYNVKKTHAARQKMKNVFFNDFIMFIIIIIITINDKDINFITTIYVIFLISY